MKYFSLLPKIKYTFSNGEYTVADLFTRVGFNNNFFKNTDLYYEEQSEKVLKPEKLSFEKYENFDYYWMLMLANNVVDVNQDWPTVQEDFGNLLEQYSKKIVYYIYEYVDVIENDILYVDEYSYGVIESWNPFYKEIVIKENFNLPTDISGVSFKIKRIVNGTSQDLINTCSENTTSFTAFGKKSYLQAPSKFIAGKGKILNPFQKVVSSQVTSELLLDTCDTSDKTAFQSTLLYKHVNNLSVNAVQVETHEDRLLSEYVDKVKLNIINPVYVPIIEDKIKLLMNDPTTSANTIFRIG